MVLPSFWRQGRDGRRWLCSNPFSLISLPPSLSFSDSLCRFPLLTLSFYLSLRENSNLRVEQTLRTLAEEERSSNEWQCATLRLFTLVSFSFFADLRISDSLFSLLALNPHSSSLPGPFSQMHSRGFCLRVPFRYLSLKLFHLLDSRMLATRKFRLF